MRANLLYEKTDHLNQDVILGPLDANLFTPVFPEDGTLIDHSNTLTFEWEPIVNATGYEIEFSPFPNFTLVLFRYETSESSLNTDEIPPNYSLYWRIRPFNDYRTCEVWSEGVLFTTGEVTSTNTINGLEAFALNPVPLQAGDALQLNFNLQEPKELNIQITDLSGKVISFQEANYPTGQHILFFDSQTLSAGIFLLRVQGLEGLITRKFVVTR